MGLKNNRALTQAKGLVPRKRIASSVPSLPRKRTLARFIRILRARLPEISERYKVKSLGVFGSYVRNEQKPDSDLDVLVEFDGFVGLYEQINLQNYISDVLGVKVDLGPRNTLKPYIGKRILSEVVWLQKDGSGTGIRTVSQIRNRNGRRKGMSPPREYLDSLKDIMEAMEISPQIIAGLTYEEFTQNKEKILALTRAIEIIGEAAKNIPSEVKAQYPEVPWKDMAGMRDRIIHGYWQVDLNEVWKVTTREIPEDKPRIARVLEEERRQREEKEAHDG